MIGGRDEVPALDARALALLREIDGTGEALGSLAALYLRDAPERMDQVAAAVAAGDLASLRELTHSIKGSSGIFGAHRLVGLAADLERGAAEGTAPHAAAVHQFTEECARVMRALALAAEGRPIAE